MAAGLLRATKGPPCAEALGGDGADAAQEPLDIDAGGSEQKFQSARHPARAVFAAAGPVPRLSATRRRPPDCRPANPPARRRPAAPCSRLAHYWAPLPGRRDQDRRGLARLVVEQGAEAVALERHLLQLLILGRQLALHLVVAQLGGLHVGFELAHAHWPDRCAAPRSVAARRARRSASRSDR